MTSDIPFILKLLHQYDQQALEQSTPRGTLPNRLLSPITETSAEIFSLSLPVNKTSSDTSQKSPNPILINNTSTIDEVHQTLLQKFHQYTNSFHQLQNYLTKLDQHLQALTWIIKHLQKDKNLIDPIEFLETRLLQIRVKRDQIDRLLNHSSIQKIIHQISPLLLKSKLVLDYHEFFTSFQLSMNQKTVLIDHLKNDYRYRNYQLNEYSSKCHQQHHLLLQLIEQYHIQHEKFLERVNSISIYNEHHRQSTELIHLDNECEQLQTENHRLTLKAKENLQHLSMLMQSNSH